MDTAKYKVLIIGSGAAGYTAGIYSARAYLDPVIAVGSMLGGQLSITTDVENYPGFAEAIQGPWLMEQMRKQAENCGAKIIYNTVQDVDLSVRPFLVKFQDESACYAENIIITTGANAKWLGLESEAFYRGFGVSACATCDGVMTKGKKVAVVGGGNTAVEEACFLAKFATEVILIHRRDTLRASATEQDRLFNEKKIRVLWNTQILEVLGSTDEKGRKMVEGVKLISNDGSISKLDVSSLFIAIGHIPATEVFKGQIKMDDDGYIITQNGTTKTNIDGVYAAGDVVDKIYRQAVTAAGMGCMAALDLEKELHKS